MPSPTQLDLHHAVGLGGHAIEQRTQPGLTIQLEIFRLEHFTAHRLGVGVAGQLAQAEILLAGRRQRHDRVIRPHQQCIALPGHLQVAGLGQHLADRHVQADHTLEEIAAVHRRNGRHHPAQAGRVQIDLGPHRPALGVVRGIGQVIEVVLRDHHVVRVLLQHIEIGVDAVVAVPAVEVDRRHQRIGLLDRAHQRVHPRQAQRLVAVLALGRRAGGIEGGGTAVVAAAVEHPARGAGMALALQGIGLKALVRQGLGHRIAIHADLCLDGAQAAVDHLALAAHGAVQVLQRTALQVTDLGLANGLVGIEVDADQHRLHQHQRDQCALQEGSPDPATQGL